MSMTLIAAMSQNRIIGNEGKLPWHMPADLQHFKSHTIDRSILMGRRTYESIGRPLPRRRNIVLTRNTNFKAEGVDVIHALVDLEQCVPNSDEVMVIGGAQIYQQCLANASRMIITVVHGDFVGDTYFPVMEHSGWFVHSAEDHAADQKNPWSYTFFELTRDGRGLPLPSEFPARLPVSS
jgi:dihydrofolate reductase